MSNQYIDIKFFIYVSINNLNKMQDINFTKKLEISLIQSLFNAAYNILIIL